MKRYRVMFSPLAEQDAAALDYWIAMQAGEDVAARYLDRLEAFTAKLSHFPDRGSRRGGASGNLRSVTFERRQLIVYEIGADIVTILRIIDAHRDWPALLPG